MTCLRVSSDRVLSGLSSFTQGALRHLFQYRSHFFGDVPGHTGSVQQRGCRVGVFMPKSRGPTVIPNQPPMAPSGQLQA